MRNFKVFSKFKSKSFENVSSMEFVFLFDVISKVKRNPISLFTFNPLLTFPNPLLLLNFNRKFDNRIEAQIQHNLNMKIRKAKRVLNILDSARLFNNTIIMIIIIIVLLLSRILFLLIKIEFIKNFHTVVLLKMLLGINLGISIE